MSEALHVPGQDAAVALLRGAVRRGEVSHAFAVLGPQAVGQQQLARWLAAALACDAADRPADAGCGRCAVCERCARGAHPSYWEFAPVGGMHRVDEVRRGWLAAATRTAAPGDWKVLRIVDADRMNDAAANAFLKVLEEPPARTTWLLDVADPDELPDTILSRCRVLRLTGWGPEELAAEAAKLGLSGEDAELAVRASLGSPATLRRLADGGLADLRAHRDLPRRLRTEGQKVALLAARELGDEVKRRTESLRAAAQDELAELTELYGEKPPSDVQRHLEQRATRQEREAKTQVLQAACDDLVGWYRDCLLVGAGGPVDQVIHGDAVDALRADADALGAEGVLAAVDLVLRTREHLELNVQTGLALEALLLELASLTIGR